MRALELKGLIKVGLLSEGRVSVNTELHLIAGPDTQPLRGNALVWTPVTPVPIVPNPVARVVPRGLVAEQVLRRPARAPKNAVKKVMKKPASIASYFNRGV